MNRADWWNGRRALVIGVDAVVGFTSEQAWFEGRYEGRGKEGSVGRGQVGVRGKRQK